MYEDQDGYISVDDVFNAQALIMQRSELYLKVGHFLYVCMYLCMYEENEELFLLWNGLKFTYSEYVYMYECVRTHTVR